MRERTFNFKNNLFKRNIELDLLIPDTEPTLEEEAKLETINVIHAKKSKKR